MGGSSYSDDFYNDRVADRAATGTPTFSHDHDIKVGKAAATAHSALDPKGVTRESRDSDAHPESTAIGVVFDVTGSMARVPITLQKKLPQLMGLLLRKGYIPDPQILFAAVGDFTSDKVPLQVGQFESGIEMDDDITKIYLEGGGGGSKEESYLDALYFFAKHTSTDCFEKRGKKGYLFLIGDEKPYPKVSKAELLSIFGDTVQDDLTAQQVVALAAEKWEIFFVIPNGTSYYSEPWLKDTWAGLINPEHVLKLEDPDAVCEAIGVAIGLLEGTATADGMAADLKDVGAHGSIVDAATSALDSLARSTSLVKAGTASRDLAASSARSTTVTRL